MGNDQSLVGYGFSEKEAVNSLISLLRYEYEVPTYQEEGSERGSERYYVIRKDGSRLYITFKSKKDSLLHLNVFKAKIK